MAHFYSSANHFNFFLKSQSFIKRVITVEIQTEKNAPKRSNQDRTDDISYVSSSRAMR